MLQENLNKLIMQLWWLVDSVVLIQYSGHASEKSCCLSYMIIQIRYDKHDVHDAHDQT